MVQKTPSNSGNPTALNFDSISIQAIVLSVILLVLAAIHLYMLITSFSGAMLVSFIIYLVFMGVTVYDTECLVRGDCNVWAWIRTVLYTILPVILIVVLFHRIGQGNTAQGGTERETADEKNEKEEK